MRKMILAAASIAALALTGPALAARAKAIRSIVVHLAATMGLDEPWQYELAATLCLIGCVALPADAFERAFQALIDRHSSLRTTYMLRDGNPFQIVHEHQKIDFEQFDASAWECEELDARLIEMAHRPFDLERGPLMRVGAIRCR